MILACTHYPLIRKEIEFFYHNRIKIYDSTSIVAEAVRKELLSNNLLSIEKKHSHNFYVSDFTESFEQTTRIFFSAEIKLEHYPLWG